MALASDVPTALRYAPGYVAERALLADSRFCTSAGSSSHACTRAKPPGRLLAALAFPSARPDLRP